MNTASAYHHTHDQIIKEANLIDLAKSDPSKFTPLYNRYHEQIFLFVLKRVATLDIAADVTSQVFLKVLLNIKKYNNINLPFASWLYRIARNEVYDLYQKNKIEMVVSLEQQDIVDIAAEILEDGVEESLVKMKIALQQLPENELELIELRFFEKRHFKEIGQVLDLSENNAKVKTYRVLEKLKKIMQNGR